MESIYEAYGRDSEVDNEPPDRPFWQLQDRGHGRSQHGTNVTSTAHERQTVNAQNRPTKGILKTSHVPPSRWEKSREHEHNVTSTVIQHVKGILKNPQASKSRWERSQNSDNKFSPLDDRSLEISHASSGRVETSRHDRSSEQGQMPNWNKGQSSNSHRKERLQSTEQPHRQSHSPSRSPRRDQSSSSSKHSRWSSHEYSKHEHGKTKKHKSSRERSPHEMSPKRRRHSGSGRSRSRSPIRSSASPNRVPTAKTDLLKDIVKHVESGEASEEMVKVLSDLSKIMKEKEEFKRKQAQGRRSSSQEQQDRQSSSHKRQDKQSSSHKRPARRSGSHERQDKRSGFREGQNRQSSSHERQDGPSGSYEQQDRIPFSHEQAELLKASPIGHNLSAITGHHMEESASWNPPHTRPLGLEQPESRSSIHGQMWMSAPPGFGIESLNPASSSTTGSWDMPAPQRHGLISGSLPVDTYHHMPYGSDHDPRPYGPDYGPRPYSSDYDPRRPRYPLDRALEVMPSGNGAQFPVTPFPHNPPDYDPIRSQYPPDRALDVIPSGNDGQPYGAQFPVPSVHNLHVPHSEMPLPSNDNYNSFQYSSTTHINSNNHSVTRERVIEYHQGVKPPVQHPQHHTIPMRAGDSVHSATPMQSSHTPNLPPQETIPNDLTPTQRNLLSDWNMISHTTCQRLGFEEYPPEVEKRGRNSTVSTPSRKHQFESGLSVSGLQMSGFTEPGDRRNNLSVSAISRKGQHENLLNVSASQMSGSTEPGDERSDMRVPTQSRKRQHESVASVSGSMSGLSEPDSVGKQMKMSEEVMTDSMKQKWQSVYEQMKSLASGDQPQDRKSTINCKEMKSPVVSETDEDLAKRTLVMSSPRSQRRDNIKEYFNKISHGELEGMKEYITKRGRLIVNLCFKKMTGAKAAFTHGRIEHDGTSHGIIGYEPFSVKFATKGSIKKQREKASDSANVPSQEVELPKYSDEDKELASRTLCMPVQKTLTTEDIENLKEYFNHLGKVEAMTDFMTRSGSTKNQRWKRDVMLHFNTIGAAKTAFGHGYLELNQLDSRYTIGNCAITARFATAERIMATRNKGQLMKTLDGEKSDPRGVSVEPQLSLATSEELAKRTLCIIIGTIFERETIELGEIKSYFTKFGEIDATNEYTSKGRKKRKYVQLIFKNVVGAKTAFQNGCLQLDKVHSKHTIGKVYALARFDTAQNIMHHCKDTQFIRKTDGNQTKLSSSSIKPEAASKELSKRTLLVIMPRNWHNVAPGHPGLNPKDVNNYFTAYGVIEEMTTFKSSDNRKFVKLIFKNVVDANTAILDGVLQMDKVHTKHKIGNYLVLVRFELIDNSLAQLVQGQELSKRTLLVVMPRNWHNVAPGHPGLNPKDIKNYFTAYGVIEEMTTFKSSDNRKFVKLIFKTFVDANTAIQDGVLQMDKVHTKHKIGNYLVLVRFELIDNSLAQLVQGQLMPDILSNKTSASSSSTKPPDSTAGLDGGHQEEVAKRTLCVVLGMMTFLNPDKIKDYFTKLGDIEEITEYTSVKRKGFQIRFKTIAEAKYAFKRGVVHRDRIHSKHIIGNDKVLVRFDTVENMTVRHKQGQEQERQTLCAVMQDGSALKPENIKDYFTKFGEIEEMIEYTSRKRKGVQLSFKSVAGAEAAFQLGHRLTDHIHSKHTIGNEHVLVRFDTVGNMMEQRIKGQSMQYINVDKPNPSSTSTKPQTIDEANPRSLSTKPNTGDETNPSSSSTCPQDSTAGTDQEEQAKQTLCVVMQKGSMLFPERIKAYFAKYGEIKEMIEYTSSKRKGVQLHFKTIAGAKAAFKRGSLHSDQLHRKHTIGNYHVLVRLDTVENMMIQREQGQRIRNIDDDQTNPNSSSTEQQACDETNTSSSSTEPQDSTAGMDHGHQEERVKRTLCVVMRKMTDLEEIKDYFTHFGEIEEMTKYASVKRKGVQIRFKTIAEAKAAFQHGELQSDRIHSKHIIGNDQVLVRFDTVEKMVVRHKQGQEQATQTLCVVMQMESVFHPEEIKDYFTKYGKIEEMAEYTSRKRKGVYLDFKTIAGATAAFEHGSLHSDQIHRKHTIGNDQVLVRFDTVENMMTQREQGQRMRNIDDDQTNPNSSSTELQTGDETNQSSSSTEPQDSEAGMDGENQEERIKRTLCVVMRKMKNLEEIKAYFTQFGEIGEMAKYASVKRKGVQICFKKVAGAKAAFQHGALQLDQIHSKHTIGNRDQVLVRFDTVGNMMVRHKQGQEQATQTLCVVLQMESVLKPQDIKDYFTKYGEIEEVIEYTSRKRKGVHLNFKTIAGAKAAFQHGQIESDTIHSKHSIGNDPVLVRYDTVENMMAQRERGQDMKNIDDYQANQSSSSTEPQDSKVGMHGEHQELMRNIDDEISTTSTELHESKTGIDGGHQEELVKRTLCVVMRKMNDLTPDQIKVYFTQLGEIEEMAEYHTRKRKGMQFIFKTVAGAKAAFLHGEIEFDTIHSKHTIGTQHFLVRFDTVEDMMGRPKLAQEQAKQTVCVVLQKESMVKPEEIKDYFTKYGEIEDIFEYTSQNRKGVHLDFKTIDGAKAAVYQGILHMDQVHRIHTIRNDEVLVRFDTVKNLMAQREREEQRKQKMADNQTNQTSLLTELQTGDETNLSSSSIEPQEATAEMYGEHLEELAKQTLCAIIGNPKDLNLEKIQDYFTQFGEVDIFEYTSRKRKGHFQLCFETDEAAKAAFQHGDLQPDTIHSKHSIANDPVYVRYDTKENLMAQDVQKPELAKQTLCICMRMSTQLDLNKIRDHFTQFGEIEEMAEYTSRKRKGVQIRFKTITAAKAAYLHNNYTVHPTDGFNRNQFIGNDHILVRFETEEMENLLAQRKQEKLKTGDDETKPNSSSTEPHESAEGTGSYYEELAKRTLCAVIQFKNKLSREQINGYFNKFGEVQGMTEYKSSARRRVQLHFKTVADASAAYQHGIPHQDKTHCQHTIGNDHILVRYETPENIMAQHEWRMEPTDPDEELANRTLVVGVTHIQAPANNNENVIKQYFSKLGDVEGTTRYYTGRGTKRYLQLHFKTVADAKAAFHYGRIHSGKEVSEYTIGNNQALARFEKVDNINAHRKHSKYKL